MDAMSESEEVVEYPRPGLKNERKVTATPLDRWFARIYFAATLISTVWTLSIYWTSAPSRFYPSIAIALLLLAITPALYKGRKWAFIFVFALNLVAFTSIISHKRYGLPTTASAVLEDLFLLFKCYAIPRALGFFGPEN
ncbi:hypothetical protein BH11ARM1_BH11ARM1_01970 [soil metagenome]